MREMIIPMLALMCLAFVQNVTFSLSSRSRNRDNVTYHIFAAGGSNIIWFLTFKHILSYDMSWLLLIPYTIGTVSGSVYGVKISMWIEKKIGASTDNHLKKKEECTPEIAFKITERFGRISLIKAPESGRCKGCLMVDPLGSCQDEFSKLCTHSDGIWVKNEGK